MTMHETEREAALAARVADLEARVARMERIPRALGYLADGVLIWVALLFATTLAVVMHHWLPSLVLGGLLLAASRVRTPSAPMLPRLVFAAGAINVIIGLTFVFVHPIV